MTNLDPNALVLFFSNEPQTCTAPILGFIAPQPTWQFAVVVPPELNAVGTINLSDPANQCSSDRASPNGGGGTCGSDEPGICKGTLQINSIDDTTLSVPLSGVPDGMGFFANDWISFNGTYTVERCPTLSP
jgi:hypothetical protein